MIRTILGDVSSEEIRGHALVHEHVQCASNDMLRAFGKRWVDEDKIGELAMETLKMLKTRKGVSVFVDGTPSDLGRNAGQLRRVSEAAGVHIVASTGLYYYPAMLTCQCSASDLAAIFCEECEHGMDGTDIRTGILKCATDVDGVTPDNAKRLAALGITQYRTGLPLYAHCRHVDGSAHRQLDILMENGANLDKVVIGHVTSRMELEYLCSILERGCYISFDQCFPGMEEKMGIVVATLCKRGYEDRLLFSLDHPIYNDFESPDRTGMAQSAEQHFSRYAYLFEKMIPAMRKAGCTEEQCASFTTSNVLNFLDIKRG